jgi:hypothetical protein
MRFLLVFALLGCSACVTQSTARTAASLEKLVGQWDELFYASSDARSHFVCTPGLRERRLKEFDRMFGARVRSLYNRRVERFGPQREAIWVTSCRLMSPDAEEQSHALGVTKFAEWLDREEHKLGLR